MFAIGRPARFRVGGVEGNRLSGMTPRLIAWDSWTRACESFANAQGVPTDLVDRGMSPSQAMFGGSKPVSAGGGFVA